MQTGQPGPVVVGLDQSQASTTAVAYAAWEARRRGLGLRLVHGFLVPVPTLTPRGPYYDEDELLDGAEERFADAVSGVKKACPGLEVATKVVAASGGKALVDESETAGLIVVGSRGEGGFPGVLLGSVAAQVAVHARCPVVVVRSRTTGDAPGSPDTAGIPGTPGVPGTGPVLVGIDGSPRSASALSFAFDEAEARGVSLVAVHVWSVSEMSALSVGRVWSPSLTIAGAQLQEAAERVLTEALAGWQQQYPRVRVRRWTAHSDEPSRILLEVAAATSADLIVVASRGRHGVAGMLLGSVSQTLVAHADVSVAVIHPEQPRTQGQR